MSLHDGHRERMRAQLRQRGLADMEPHQILEVVLFYAQPRGDTNALAHVLIDRFGTLAAVLDAPCEELLKVPGVGEGTATFLHMLPQLLGAYMHSKEEARPVLDSAEAAGRYFIPLFIGISHEELHMASLNDKRQLIRSVKITDGIVNSAPVMVKRIIAEAIAANATGVILAHNHPAGLALPSREDRAATFQIHRALRQINVQLLDHLVIYHTDFVSMAQSGDFVQL